MDDKYVSFSLLEIYRKNSDSAIPEDCQITECTSIFCSWPDTIWLMPNVIKVSLKYIENLHVIVLFLLKTTRSGGFSACVTRDQFQCALLCLCSTVVRTVVKNLPKLQCPSNINPCRYKPKELHESIRGWGTQSELPSTLDTIHPIDMIFGT